MGSLEISIDERKFLDDENIIPFHTTILDASHLRTCANHTSSFPDIDHDGSIDTFSNHEENDKILCNHTLDTNDNQRGQNSRKKDKHLKHLASLDDI